MVPAHRGQKVSGAEQILYDKTGHNVLIGTRIDTPYKRRPKTEAEKKLAETIAGFTTVVDKTNSKSRLRLKFGFNRLGQFQLNFIDQHGYAFVNFDQYEIENLFAALLLNSGLLDGRYRKKKGHRKVIPQKGIHNINIGKIEHEKLRSRGLIYCPKRYWSMGSLMLWKYQDVKQRRAALTNKRLGLRLPTMGRMQGIA